MSRRKHLVTVGRWNNRKGKLVVSWRDLTQKRRTQEFPDNPDGAFEARQFVAKTEMDLHRGISGPDGRLTFGQLAESWMAVQRVTLRRPTVKRYFSDLKTKFLPAWAERPALTVQTPQVTQVLVGLMGQGLARSTVASCLSTLSALFEWGKANRYLDHDPTEGVKKTLKLTKQTTTRRPLTEDEVGRFLKAARQLAPQYMLHFLTFMETGARLGEALAFRDEVIDPDSLTFEVRDQVSDDGSMVAPKTDHSARRIRVSRGFMELVIQTYVDRRNAGLISPWLLEPHFSSPPTAKQYHRATRKLYEAFKRTAALAGLPKRFSPHWLRHTYASDLLSHGARLDEVSGNLGHTAKSTTLNIYYKAIGKPSSTADEAAERRRVAEERADLMKTMKFAVRRVAQQVAL